MCTFKILVQTISFFCIIIPPANGVWKGGIKESPSPSVLLSVPLCKICPGHIFLMEKHLNFLTYNGYL